VATEFPRGLNTVLGSGLLSLLSERLEASVDGLHGGLEVFLMLLQLFLHFLPLLIIQLIKLNVF
jgi:hypothetical protein